jgi:hypothetical protein
VVVRLQEHAVVLLLLLLLLLLMLQMLQMLLMMLMMLMMLLMLLVLPRHGGIPAGALLLLSLLVLLRSHVVQGMQPRRLRMRMRMRMRMHLCRLRWACSSTWGPLLGYLLLHLLLLLGQETLFGLLPLLVAALLLLLGAHRDGCLQEQGLGRLCAAVFALWRLLLGQVLWLQRQ